MPKKPTEKESKNVTLLVFEKHQDFMAQQFAKVFERLDQHSKILNQHSKVLETMLKEMQEGRKEANDQRMMISSLNHADVSQYRKIEGLEIRIEKLEEKIK